MITGLSSSKADQRGVTTSMPHFIGGWQCSISRVHNCKFWHDSQTLAAAAGGDRSRLSCARWSSSSTCGEQNEAIREAGFTIGRHPPVSRLVGLSHSDLGVGRDKVRERGDEGSAGEAVKNHEVDVGAPSSKPERESIMGCVPRA